MEFCFQEFWQTFEKLKKLLENVTFSNKYSQIDTLGITIDHFLCFNIIYSHFVLKKVKKSRFFFFSNPKKNPLQSKIILFKFSKMFYIIDQKHDKIRQNPFGYSFVLFYDW